VTGRAAQNNSRGDRGKLSDNGGWEKNWAHEELRKKKEYFDIGALLRGAPKKLAFHIGGGHQGGLKVL